MMVKPIQYLKDNTQPQIVVSVVVGSLVVGLISFVAMKSGVKTLAQIAKNAK